MDRAKTLFTVESTGPFIYHPHHARFRVTKQLQFRTDNFASRSTPSEGEASTPAPEAQTRTYLHFTVDNVGDQSRFIFGGHRDSCDVYVQAAKPISNRLFAVELENNGRIALLKNLSSRGIEIRSPAYGRQKIRSQRALVPGDEVKIHVSGFNILVHFFNHEDQHDLHKLYLQQLGRRFTGAVPGMNQLDLKSKQSSSRAPGDAPYSMLAEIGRGAYGTVYRAMHSYSGALVAIKVFRKPGLGTLKEAAILQGVSHMRIPAALTLLLYTHVSHLQSNIMRFVEFISPGHGQGLSIMVMELLEHPNLETALKQQAMLLDQTSYLLGELLHGLAYLHSMHITHRDLKPANIILISREPISIKLTDFGLATARSEHLTTHCGSLPYLAPEVHGRSYTNKVDMWSVGVIALELVTGLPDYPNRHADWPGLLQGRLEAAVDALCYGFIKSLLRSHANRRPSAQQSLRDRFLHIESNFLDAIPSPTEYASTPSEYRAEDAFPHQPEGSATQLRHRSQNAPSPPGYAAETRVFAPLVPPPPRESYAQIQAPPPPAQPQGPVTTYWKLTWAGKTVMYRRDDRLINVTQLIKANGYNNRVYWSSIEKRLGSLDRVLVNGGYTSRSYVSMADAHGVLQSLHLPTASIQDLLSQINRYRQ